MIDPASFGAQCHGGPSSNGWRGWCWRGSRCGVSSRSPISVTGCAMPRDWPIHVGGRSSSWAGRRRCRRSRDRPGARGRRAGRGSQANQSLAHRVRLVRPALAGPRGRRVCSARPARLGRRALLVRRGSRGRTEHRERQAIQVPPDRLVRRARRDRPARPVRRVRTAGTKNRSPCPQRAGRVTSPHAYETRRAEIARRTGPSGARARRVDVYDQPTGVRT